MNIIPIDYVGLREPPKADLICPNTLFNASLAAFAYFPPSLAAIIHE